MPNAMDEPFIDDILQIIFEDIDSGKKFEDLEKQSDEIFETLNKSDKDSPFNVRLLVNKPEDTTDIKMTVPTDDEETIKLKVDPYESKIDPSMVTPKGITNIKFKMTQSSNDSVDQSDIEKFKIKVPDAKEETKNIKLKIDDKKQPSNVVSINMKIPKKDEGLEKSQISLDLQSNEELKDLLKSDNPNQILVSSINVMKDCKLAVDRLVSLVPNDDVLVKTQNIIMELLTRINEDHEQLVKDKDRCKELAVNVAKFILDLKNYLKIKFTELKDDVEDTENKDTNLDNKMEQISDDVKEAKKNQETGNTEKHKSSNDSTIQTIENNKIPSIQTTSSGQNNFGVVQFNH